MKQYISIFSIFFLLMGCRPQEDLTITDSSVFDYNFQVFIKDKNNDTLSVNQWYQYEVYLKPLTTNKLLNFQQKIVLSPVVSVGKLGSYQILNLHGDSLTSVQRFGDVVQLSNDSLINNRFIIKEKFDNPNVQGAITQTTTVLWNSISKVVNNNIYVK